MKPFRFGVNVGPSRSRAEWVEKARKLEGLGYDTLTVPDHLADFFAPMPALVSAAEATTTFRLGTNVLNNDFRHPVLVAREAATVDLLTGGRFELGSGAGYMQSEYDQAGLVFDTSGTRVERLAEAVTVIKGLLSCEPVTFSGLHYRVTGHRIHPLPVQRPQSADRDQRQCPPAAEFGGARSRYRRSLGHHFPPRRHRTRSFRMDDIGPRREAAAGPRGVG